MCVPRTPPINMTAQPTPSMQSADNLQLAGDAGNRGAAQLGRLMLRVGGASSAAQSSSTANAATTAAASQATPTPTPPAAGSAGAAAAKGFQVPSLAGLRNGLAGLGNLAPATAF